MAKFVHYECPHCHKGFWTDTHRVKHVEKVHPEKVAKPSKPADN